MPYGYDNRDDRWLIDHAADTPFEAQMFFGHVNFAFRKDMHPVANGKLLDAEIDGGLIYATTSYDGYAFAYELNGEWMIRSLE